MKQYTVAEKRKKNQKNKNKDQRQKGVCWMEAPPAFAPPAELDFDRVMMLSIEDDYMVIYQCAVRFENFSHTFVF